MDGDRRWVIFRRARFAFDDLVFADEDGIAFSGFVGLGSSGTVTTSARLAKIILSAEPRQAFRRRTKIANPVRTNITSPSAKVDWTATFSRKAPLSTHPERLTVQYAAEYPELSHFAIWKACPGLVVGNGYTLPIARLTAGVGTMSNFSDFCDKSGLDQTYDRLAV